MTQKKLLLIILLSCAVVTAAIAFAAGFGVDTASRARTRLSTETASLESRRKNLETQKDEMTEKLDELKTELSTKDNVNSYYMEYQKSFDALTLETDSLKKQSEQLDAEIAEKEAEAEKAGKIKGTLRGKTYSLNKNETYSCPDKIPEGRYIISGRGTVVIYSSNGKTRAAENLDVAYNNSYTFDLKKNEKIKPSENATLTELK